MIIDAESWSSVEEWWDVFVTTDSILEVDSSTLVLEPHMLEGEWACLESWWGSYSEVRQSDVIELQGLLRDFRGAWKQSTSRFDRDPLDTDWSYHSNTRGPLRTYHEENWSQWLCHLLRSGPAAFLEELLGFAFDAPPDTVEREAHLPAPDGTDRFADILVHSPERNVSIEVKRGDEHYEKTRNTARLIERHHTGEWTHVLLLPEYKAPALQAAFGEHFEDRDNARPQIRSETGSIPISVTYWRDVSASLRKTMLGQVEPSPHWAASAYLFCTIIEQKQLGFNPTPIIEDVAQSDDIIHLSQPISVATGAISDQIRYLRELLTDLEIEEEDTSK